MGLTDNGDQILTFDYLQEGRSQGFNQLNHKLLGQGVLEGGTFSKVADDEIEISEMICIIRDDTNDVTIRMETTDVATVDSITSATPYIIARLIWINTANNYVDFLAVAQGSITTTDLILGKLQYSGTTLSTTFDYAEKSWHPFKILFDNKDFLKVVPNEPYDDQVTVTAGSIYINGIFVDISDTVITGNFSATTADPRIDLVSIDSTGQINITAGVASPSPAVPDFPTDELMLAKVTIPLGINPCIIQGDYIANYNYEHFFTLYSGTSTEFEDSLDGTEGSPKTELGKSGLAVKGVTDALDSSISTNTGNISTNTGNISTNTSDITAMKALYTNRVYAEANTIQAVPNATYTTVNYNNVVTDLGNCFNGTVWTAPFDGVFLFNIGILFNSYLWASGDYIYGRILHSAGPNELWQYIDIEDTQTIEKGIYGSASVFAEENDTVSIQVIVGRASAGGGTTNLEIHDIYHYLRITPISVG